MHGDLAGRTAVVSGRTRGIGFETARQVVRLGGRIAILEVDGAAAREYEKTVPRLLKRHVIPQAVGEGDGRSHGDGRRSIRSGAGPG